MSALISAGLDLVIYGMGTVFVFLALLVLVTMVMSALVQLLGNGDEAAGVSGAEDPALLAAVSAAVKFFRKNKNHSA